MSYVVRFHVNGSEVLYDGDPLRPLATVIRDECRLTGTKIGCSAGDCGACTVLLDGTAVASCLIPVVRAENSAVTTIEGLANDHRMHPLQAAFARHNASQCGYCIPGIIMALVPLIDRSRPLTRAAVIDGLAGNLCRCTGYQSVIEAALEAGAAMEAEGKSG